MGDVGPPAAAREGWSSAPAPSPSVPPGARLTKATMTKASRQCPRRNHQVWLIQRTATRDYALIYSSGLWASYGSCQSYFLPLEYTIRHLLAPPRTYCAVLVYLVASFASFRGFSSKSERGLPKAWAAPQRLSSSRGGSDHSAPGSHVYQLSSDVRFGLMVSRCRGWVVSHLPSTKARDSNPQTTD